MAEAGATAVQGFRLSPQQQRLWRLWEAGVRRTLVVQCVLAVEGEVEVEGLGAALSAAVARHEILRTTFRRIPGLTQPVQVVGEAWAPEIETVDLRGLAPEEVAEALGELLAAQRETPFDLAAGPLLRALVLELGPGDRGLVLSLPALLADARSLQSLALELAATCTGAAPAGESLQYADAAEVLHEWLEAEGEGWAFWRRQDLGALGRVRLPARRRGTEPEEASGPAVRRVVRRLDGDAAAEVLQLADALGVESDHVVLAAWYAALWHSTGERDLVVGVGFDGRTAVELEEALGPYARYVPVAVSVDAGATLGDLAANVAAAAVRAGEQQDSYSLEAFEGSLPEEGGPRPWPFGFDAVLPEARSEVAPGWTVRVERATLDHFEVRLGARVDEEGVELAIDHDEDLVGGLEAERLADRLVRVLEAAADAPLESLDVLSPEERRELVGGLQRHPGRTETFRPVHETFADRARKTPEAVAVVAGAHRVTFGELAARAGQTARRLRRLGLGTDALVGICLERSPSLVEVVLGVLEAGAAFVPLDPAHPPERLRSLVADAGLAALVSRGPLLATLGELPAGTASIDLDGPAAGDPPGEAAAAPAAAVDPESLAYVIHTSGSTGRPKGVMVSHRSLAGYVEWAVAEYGPEAGGAPVHSSIAFDLTLTALFAPLLAGSAAALVPDEEAVTGLARLLRAGARFGLVKLTPSHLEVLGHLVPPGELAGRVGTLILGGEALRAEAVAAWRTAAPGTRLVNEYGPTEAVVGCSAHTVSPEDPETGPVPIGGPIAGARLYVLGPALRPVPAGVPGELWIGGPGVARGYLRLPRRTAERFVPDPFAAEAGKGSGQRLYRTGDRVRLDPGGGLLYLGRLDHQIKLRGHRIEPGEVEAALVAEPGVREAAVVARDSTAGAALVAYVVPAAGRPQAARLREGLAARLPEFMVPAAFVFLDALPLTPNGKLDRAALPEPREAEEERSTYAEPRTVEEDLLAELWARVLGVERVGIDDHFFALGGDSIRSIQVLSLAQERGIELTLEDLFARPTIRGLADAMAAGGERTRPPAPAPFGLLTAEERASLPEGVEDAFPLSRLQGGMIFHSAFDSGSGVYHDLHSFRVRGPLELPELEAALQEVFRRHPVLRSSFDLERPGRPLQRIHRHVPASLEVHDLAHLDAGARRPAVEAWLREQATRPFAWDRLPLLAFHVHRYDGETFQLTLSFHHAVLDGWSAATLLTELFAGYLALVRGERPAHEAPPEGIYREFVARELDALGSEATREFWRDLLDGAEHGRLPRWPSEEGEPGPARSLAAAVPDACAASLRRLADDLVVPLKSVLLAAHLRVLATVCAGTDVVTGLVSNGRPERPGAERALGLYLNTLPFRLEVGRGETWSELVVRCFDLERSLLPHRRLPLAEIQAETGHGALFDTVFNFLHYHVYRGVEACEGLELLDRWSFEETNFPLGTTFVLDAASGTRLRLQLNSPAAQLHPAQAEALLGYYLRALESLAEAPGAAHADADLLGTAERHRLLAEWGDGGPPLGAAAPVFEVLETRIRETPDAVAVADERLRLSYGGLLAAAEGLTRRLRGLGAGPEARVGLFLERGPELVVAILAVFRAGAAYVPLDPNDPDERLDWLLDDAGLSVVVSQAPWHERIVARGMPVVRLDGDSAPRPQPGAAPPAAVGPDHLAYVLYTSGSTGRPKGVEVTHRGLGNLAAAQIDIFDVRPGDRMLQFAAATFDASLAEIVVALLGGAELHTAAGGRLLPDQELVETLRRRALTHLTLPPSALAVLPPDDLPSLRTLVVAGEVCPPDLIRRWARGRRAVNAYGPTETTVCATAGAVEERGPLSIGEPLPGFRVRVLGPDLELVPSGTPGELLLGGPSLARGYRRRPGRTAESFVPDPDTTADLPGARLYRTGDRVRWLPGGELEFLGRIDHQVKLRGFRIELGEVERALLDLPAVRQAVVVLREDEDGHRRLAAYVSPAEGAEVVPAELREALSRRLPAHMVPAAWTVLESLPTTTSGKLDRRTLARIEPSATGVAEPGHAPPRSAVERVLAEVWQEVLGCGPVGVHDNFFGLGGDSILSIQASIRARRRGVAVSPRQIFEHQTVAELASVAVAAAAESFAGGPESGPLPLTPIQRWFFDDWSPERHHDNQALLLVPESPLDLPRLAASLRRLEARHGALRLRFHRRDGEWRQAMLPPSGRPPLTVVDLAALPEAGRARALAAATAQAHRSLHLERGPIHRVLYARGAPGDGDRLLWVTHHLAVDAVSWRILLDELTEDYEARGEGREPAPPPPASLRGWAEELLRWAADGAAESELAVWLRPAWAEAVEVPADLGEGDGAGLMADEESAFVELDGEATRVLLERVPEVYNAGIQEAVVSALARALAAWRGRPQVALDLEGHGREELIPGLDLSRTVGWLTALYPVCVDLEGCAGPADALTRVKEELRRIPAGGAGFGAIRYLGPHGRGLAAIPPRAVVFNYLGRLDRALPGVSLLRPAAEGAGAFRSPRAARPHLLAVTAVVAGGRLRVSCGYSRRHHRRATVERLLAAVEGGLRELAEICRGATSAEYTPSDFPLSGLDRDELAQVLAARKRGVER